MIIFFDGVSGVGKTRFLDYCHRQYGITVFSIKQNMTWRHREKAKEFLAYKNGLNSMEARLFYFDLWLQLCHEIIATSKDKKDLFFVDRSPVSTTLYNGDATRVVEMTVKELLHDRNIKTVLCDGNTNLVRKNKGLKSRDKLLDHSGIECSHMLKVWREYNPFCKEWDYVAHMVGYKDNPKRLFEHIISHLGIKIK